MPRVAHAVSLLAALATAVSAQPVPLVVNTASREEVRQFFRAVYHASQNVPAGWSGSYATGTPGETTAAYKEATRLRINFYRALAGLPAEITFSPAYNANAQQAAFMMSRNGALSHAPPPSWTGYNAVGADGASNSNLALGEAGPAAIDNYIADPGDNNAVVGHRRWLLYPQTLQMGTGDVPGLPNTGTFQPANATWVIDTTPGGQFGATRPATRTTAVAYPPSGFIPYQIVWPRWSLSYPGADFSAATVTMSRHGRDVPTAIEPVASVPGEPTLAWTYDQLDSSATTPHVRPAADTTYTVQVGNVRIGGAARNFTYDVTVFDPELAGSDFVPVSIAGPSFPVVGGPNSYGVSQASFTRGFDWRAVQLTPLTKTFTAESGLEGLTAATSLGYEVVQPSTVATGARAYRLAHVDPRADEILRIPGTYLASGPDAAIAFRSRLAIATPTETARVQISTDEGRSWHDIYAQPGRSSTSTDFPAATEATFVNRTLSLASYEGRSINLRLAYSIGFGSAFLPGPTNTVGWFIDDLTLTGVQEISAAAPSRVAAGSAFSFIPATPGPVALQARGLMFSAYPMEWGPITSINALKGDSPGGAAFLTNLSVRTRAGTEAQTLIVGFTLSGGRKPLLIRGIGPALTGFGVPGALTDPTLQLYRRGARISENDNWAPADAATFEGVGAFGLDRGSRDAAIVVALEPDSYTTQLSGAGGGTGVALVELYDAAATETGPRLANVSARAQVGTGSDLLIAGFSISGQGSRALLIRAVGPTLGVFGVSGALADPKLELFRGGQKIEENDNWSGTAQSSFAPAGAFDLVAGSRDAVLMVALPAGSYTAQVSGVAGSTGVALIEIYELR